MRMRKLCPPDLWAEVEQWSAGWRLLSIIPSKDLGGFFRGTLNFKTEKAHDLIALGYGDTLRLFQTFCRQQEAAAGSTPK